MDRREALARVLSIVPAGSMLKETKAEPKPLLFVLTVPETIDDEAITAFYENWQRSLKGPPPLIIIPEETTLEAVMDPRNKSEAEG